MICGIIHNMNKNQRIQKAIELYTKPKEDDSYYAGTEIAKILNVHSSTIYTWLKSSGIKPSRKGMRNAVLTSKQIEWAIWRYTTLLEDGTWMGSKTIAKRLNVATPTIIHHLKKHGVKIRTPKEFMAHGKACKPRNKPIGEAPLCACGCGKKTEWVSKENKWQAYYPSHYHSKKPFHDKEYLLREYVEKKRNAIDIANNFGVNQTAIIYWLKKHSIPRRSQAESLRLSGKVRGKNNAAWKGGIADWDYSHDWKSVCKQIKDRDKWTCQRCKKTKKRWGNLLHVHHIDENKLNNNPSNLISLCATCHMESHGNQILRDYYTFVIKNIV